MRFFLSFFIVVFISCQQQKTTSSGADSAAFDQSSSNLGTHENSDQITCWGIGSIELGDDLPALEEKLGKDNLVQDSLMLEGMFEGLITKAWRGTSREITIVWKEKKAPFNTIDYLEISQPNAPYAFANGIKIGTTLKEIEKMNGKSLKLYGFGWDYGGTFVSFDKGKLAGEIPCFGGVFSLEAEQDSEELRAIMGDQEISSTHPSFDKYQVKLAKIRVVNKG
ncbi:hypothetical protein [Pedobacter sp. SYSU D00535]|uniref:hypothetical protein n=1 Tax=Pedobacter sp. SYSU D00535 TaxID=2810308 RepID=UPI001A95F1E5|nr:hypothetical protein [Pedobacter sp. SYSU D00535]